MSIRLGRHVVNEPTLQSILDFLPYPFIVSECRNGARLNSFVNKKFLEEIGYAPEEMPTIEEWFGLAYPDPEYRLEVKTQWDERIHEARLNGKDSVSLQVQIRNKKGENRWYEVTASTNEPQMVAFADIHEVKTREEKLRRLNENRDRILSVLGHDLRGPITHMHILSKMAMSNQISQEDFSKMMAEVNFKAFQTMEFLNTTVVWAKSNFNAIKINLEPVDLQKLIYDVSNLYSQLLELKNVKVTQQLDVNGLVSDKEILTTVVRNLISNAIKFSLEKGEIIVNTHSLPQDGCRISVTDFGMGMSPEKIKQIESLHYQSSIGTFGEKGLGIGLMLSAELLLKLDSKLKFVSKLDSGTTVSFDLYP